MKILATADIHSPRYLALYLRKLSPRKTRPDIILLAGDIVERGRWRECTRVITPLREKWPSTPIVSVYGNEEYDEIKELIIKTCGEAIWLDDEYIRLEVGDLKIGVVGTRGALDKPTPWQARHVPGISRVYQERIAKIGRLLLRSRYSDEVTILLTHYPPRCKTLTGEDERFWENMSSKHLATVVERTKPDIVVHGHLHKSIVHRDTLGGVPVYNSALPALKDLLEISYEGEKRGLLGFLGGGQ